MFKLLREIGHPSLSDTDAHEHLQGQLAAKALQEALSHDDTELLCEAIELEHAILHFVVLVLDDVVVPV